MNDKVGVLIVGVLGHLATTMIFGALALKKGLCKTTGMVTALKDFSGMDLVGPEDIIFGGWDIRSGSLLENSRKLMKEIHFFDTKGFSEIQEEMKMISKNIFHGTMKNCGEAIEELSPQIKNKETNSLRETINRLMYDIELFKKKNNLNRVIVINLASTEPPLLVDYRHSDGFALERTIEENHEQAIMPSTLYAYASVNSGHPYINFTPSNGAMIPGILDLAETREVPVMGSDGKTGETLVKSALAPMFLSRNLKILSWEGYNILGNMDGKVLSHDENKRSKIKSKDQVLSRILGYKPHAQVSIDYVPSLGDWKTAWDFIHFEGFLNTRMSLQFTWQGCDSVLAAPLVLDIIRLTTFAHRKREKGLLKHLACFFKSPIGVEEHNLFEQFKALQDYARQQTSNGYHAKDGVDASYCDL
ncbi:MAG: inositol-3-phosphate synthase [Thermodesulfobacteriota bacterium]|nr:inositol-3-phosphate synthase [Thermodesulfobacteriota bacterium]